MVDKPSSVHPAPCHLWQAGVLAQRPQELENCACPSPAATLKTVGTSFTMLGQNSRAGPDDIVTGEPVPRVQELESLLYPLPSVALGEPARACPGGLDAGGVAG